MFYSGLIQTELNIDVLIKIKTKIVNTVFSVQRKSAKIFGTSTCLGNLFGEDLLVFYQAKDRLKYIISNRKSIEWCKNQNSQKNEIEHCGDCG